MRQYEAIIFDLDGVLVRSFTTKPLPGAKERIAALKVQGVPIAIATNQAGPLWRYVTGDQKYPDAAQIVDNFRTIIDALGLQDVHWFVSIGDKRVQEMVGFQRYQVAYAEIYPSLMNPFRECLHIGSHEWRKPAPDMLLAIARHFNVNPANCLFVGDMETDRQAAAAAGMQFEMVESDA